jgi:uncharacterized membrane protein
MIRLKQFWSNLQSSFWFVPSLIVLSSVVLAAGLIAIDYTTNDLWLSQWPLLFGVGAEGARGMMTTIAGAMMSVVGVTFSMVLVVLVLASSQYSPRILRNFMRSRITQIVLGTFSGIFTYCLVVLCIIRGAVGEEFVPALAVMFGFVLALGGVATLIFFIHHIASSMLASNIISSIADETLAAIDHLFPQDIGQESEKDEYDKVVDSLSKLNWYAVPTEDTGYIQRVDKDALLSFARDRKTVVWMYRGIGDFVVQNTVLVHISLEEPPDGNIISSLQRAFIIGHQRTVEQDAAFGIRQIVDIALKALSPGIVDVTTAVVCVDYLTNILSRLVTREIPSYLRYDDDGELRVIAKGPNFESMLEESFGQIRDIAKGDIVIISRLLSSFQTIASLTNSPRRLRSLNEQVKYTAEEAERTVESSHNRDNIKAQLISVKKDIKVV